MKLKAFFKLILFTAGFLLINNRLTEIFAIKQFPPIIANVNSLADQQWLGTMRGGFYSEKKNSIDVVFVGSSQIFCDINPNVLWNEYGITSYDFSAHRQDPGTSYYYLKQMFETQSPKLVVIDLYSNGEINLDDSDLASAHYNFDHMKKDIYRTEAIWNRTKTHRLETFFPIMMYNQRWKELGKDELFFKPVKHDFLKGAFLYMAENQWEGSYRDMPEDSELPGYTLPEQTVHWLNAILDLCKKHNCEVLFIKTPVCIFGYDYASQMTDLVFYSYIRELERYCEKNGISFLNMIRLVDEIGLDYRTDFVDSIHLNWYGMEKFSVYLGKYLQETYGLENHKDDPGMEQWDEDYAQMRYYTDNFSELYQDEAEASGESETESNEDIFLR